MYVYVASIHNSFKSLVTVVIVQCKWQSEKSYSLWLWWQQQVQYCEQSIRKIIVCLIDGVKAQEILMLEKMLDPIPSRLKKKVRKKRFAAIHSGLCSSNFSHHTSRFVPFLTWTSTNLYKKKILSKNKQSPLKLKLGLLISFFVLLFFVFIQLLHHWQDVTQGQFLSKVNPVWIVSFSSSRLIA